VGWGLGSVYERGGDCEDRGKKKARVKNGVCRPGLGLKEIRWDTSKEKEENKNN